MPAPMTGYTTVELIDFLLDIANEEECDWTVLQIAEELNARKIPAINMAITSGNLFILIRYLIALGISIKFSAKIML